MKLVMKSKTGWCTGVRDEGGKSAQAGVCARHSFLERRFTLPILFTSFQNLENIVKLPSQLTSL